MLRTRVITALVLLAVLVALLYLNSLPVFVVVAAIFFAAAVWESLRLFRSKRPMLAAGLWTVVFVVIAFHGAFLERLLFGLCVAIWVIRLAPALAIGLPDFERVANRLLNGLYGIAILGCFVAILALFKHSALYLFSALAIVWIADIGAYFSGKAFGRRKLAPSISPGKSWEGAIGGWLAVLVVAAATVALPELSDTFAVKLQTRWGWPGLFAVLSALVAASIVGDLFESQLKRRAGRKDSSNLLPGHGGVLDRIDALIPALPLAVLVDFWI